MKKVYLLIPLLATSLGCNKLSPAGFWQGFDKADIVNATSDQGPWGGKRTITWYNAKGKFSESDILKFAGANGWKLTLVKNIDTAVNSENRYRKGNLADTGFTIYGGNTAGDMRFPGCVHNNCKLYQFDSGWTIVREDKTLTANGYLLVNADKTRMAMFHSWGE